MFKNAIFYRIGPDFTMPSHDALEQRLAQSRFTACGPTQEVSSGWVEPRGEKHGDLVEIIAGQYIFKLRTETKSVPASAIKEALDERLAHIYETTGRKPGAKEKREIKDEIKLDMLPRAFSKHSSTMAWIDPHNRILVLDSPSLSKADKIVTMIVEAMTEAGSGINLSLIETNTTSATAMAHWLSEQEAPYNFTTDRECQLKAPDESKSAVKYSRHDLDIKEIQEHIKHGKVPTSLAMTWGGRVSFTLTDQMQLKKVTMLDVVIEENASEGQYFDGDITILTTELSALIPDLLEALDGEVVNEHESSGHGSSGSDSTGDDFSSPLGAGGSEDHSGDADAKPTDLAVSTDDFGDDGISFTSENFGEGVLTSSGLQGHLPANPSDSFGGEAEFQEDSSAAMV